MRIGASTYRALSPRSDLIRGFHSRAQCRWRPASRHGSRSLVVQRKWLHGTRSDNDQHDTTIARILCILTAINMHDVRVLMRLLQLHPTCAASLVIDLRSSEFGCGPHGWPFHSDISRQAKWVNLWTDCSHACALQVNLSQGTRARTHAHAHSHTRF